MDLGDPCSYLTLEPGAGVVGSDGEVVGRVKHVLFDEGADVFDGIVIDLKAGPGGLHFADADQVAEIHERGVVLSISSAEAHELPKPAANPAVMENHGVEDSESPLQHKLHRAWELISGKG
jgi:hypothetical protein